ncbi:hypothetical protein R3X28_19250, partial [Maribacter sp. TH_r10]|nr:hypothetical protein [Maribacter sp. TH_r10]
STVNGEASIALDLSPAINAMEKTTTVVEGTGIDVSSTTSGNNTEYTVTVDPTDIVGDGSITSPNSTITLGGTPANSILENVTLDVNESSLADGSVTSPNSTIILGGTPANAIFEDVTMDVDVSALTGDGSITSPNSTITLTGTPANSLLENVGLDVNETALADGSITSPNST